MNVIVVESTHFVPEEREIAKNITDDVFISIHDKQYCKYTRVIGVFATADESREFIEKEKQKILVKYGEKYLDDSEDEMHEYYTFGTSLWEVNEDIVLLKMK